MLDLQLRVGHEQRGVNAGVDPGVLRDPLLPLGMFGSLQHLQERHLREADLRGRQLVGVDGPVTEAAPLLRLTQLGALAQQLVGRLSLVVARQRIRILRR